MFLRRRSQRVRHANSDSVVTLQGQHARDETEVERLEEEWKHKVEDLQEKAKEIKVCMFILLLSIMTERAAARPLSQLNRHFYATRRFLFPLGIFGKSTVYGHF